MDFEEVALKRILFEYICSSENIIKVHEMWVSYGDLYLQLSLQSYSVY